MDDSWFVVDSEDEGAFTGLPHGNSSGAIDRSAAAGNPTSDISVIQTAAFTPDLLHTPQRGPPSALADESLFTPPPARRDSTIGTFTSAPSPSRTPPVIAPKPRPRPRVVIKKAVTNNSADTASTSFSYISEPISARPTNDSIQPATATSFVYSEVAGDAFSSLDIAERAKMCPRKKTQPAKTINPPEINEVIELTSDEDELSLKPTKRQRKQVDPKPQVPTKPRPKPRLRVKRAAAVPDGSPPPSEIMDRNPQTSPTKDTSSSQLPPSTLPTIPPSTPPQAREPTPFSSPLVVARKRKRTRPAIAEDDGEMDKIIASNLVGPSLPEPTPFFAPSSSSLPTDSGIEILPPVESLNGRGKKKQTPASKKGTQTKPQNKGRKGKKAQMSNAVGLAEEPAGMIQEPSTPPACHNTSARCSPVVGSSTVTKKASKSVTKKGKAREIDYHDDEPLPPSQSNAACTSLAREEEGQKIKENLRPDEFSPPKRDPPERTLTTPGPQARGFAVKSKLTPMSELIRRVNLQPCSPFPNATRTYSPFLKSSRTMLTRIAPLHPNRRTPPPPLPRPPPPKKSKKQLELEERIEEELAETVDGWSCLTDEERKALRKARIDAELGYE